MGDFKPDQIIRDGNQYFTIEVQEFGAPQNKLAVEFNGGNWTLDAVDYSTGESRYQDLCGGQVKYQDLTIKYLQTSATGFGNKLAAETATGKGAWGKRFNATATFKTPGNKTCLTINWVECQLVSHKTSGFNSTASGEPCYEWLTLRPTRAECS